MKLKDDTQYMCIYLCCTQTTHIKVEKEIQLWIEFNKCKKKKSENIVDAIKCYTSISYIYRYYIFKACGTSGTLNITIDNFLCDSIKMVTVISFAAHFFIAFHSYAFTPTEFAQLIAVPCHIMEHIRI